MIKCSSTVQIVDCKHFNFLLHDWKQNTKSEPSFILVFFSFSVAAGLTGGIGLESNNTHRLNYLQEQRRLIKHKAPTPEDISFPAQISASKVTRQMFRSNVSALSN
jgi:hypothetical protein